MKNSPLYQRVAKAGHCWFSARRSETKGNSFPCTNAFLEVLMAFTRNRTRQNWLQLLIYIVFFQHPSDPGASFSFIIFIFRQVLLSVCFRGLLWFVGTKKGFKSLVGGWKTRWAREWKLKIKSSLCQKQYLPVLRMNVCSRGEVIFSGGFIFSTQARNWSKLADSGDDFC